MPASSAAIRAAFSQKAETTLCRELESLPCTECVALAAELMQEAFERSNTGLPQ